MTALPVPTLPSHAPPAPALSAAHLSQLAASHDASRTIRRAVAFSKADGWGVGVCAVLTLLFGLTTVSGILLGTSMAFIAAVELWSSRRLRRLDPSAARLLGWNQLALACVLIAYAAWRIYCEMTGTGEYAALVASDPMLGRALAPIEDLTRLVTYCLYGGLIAVAVFAQGGLALYYFTREKHVRAYLAQTPEWVLAVQRAGGPG